MAIDSANKFFAVVEKSRLLDGRQLADARKETAGCEDPTEIARTLARQGVVTRWQASQLLAGRGTFFLGKYKLLELLGRGGMGRVFLGRHVTMNRRVALKLLSRQIMKDEASLKTFFAEARAVAALDHPNIVQTYSIDNEADRYYIAMEFVEGRDLGRIVEEDGPLDFVRAADYIRQAAEGLAHAHENDMVHGDVKPSNLLVNDQGKVKILDMGLARLRGGSDGSTAGTDERSPDAVDYLAPELARKNPRFDHRADLYSLGCTLYFLLTGKPPFDNGLLHERLMRHRTQEPPSLLDQRADTPAELADLCRRMMAKKAEDRPESAAEVSKILRKWRLPTAKPAAPRAKPVAKALPSIQVDSQPQARPTPMVAVKSPSSRGTDKTGLLATKRGKTIAALAGTAIALLVATTAVIVGGGFGGNDKTNDAGNSKTVAERSPGDSDLDVNLDTNLDTDPKTDPDTEPTPSEPPDEPEEEGPEEPEPDEDPLDNETSKTDEPEEPTVDTEPPGDPEQPNIPKNPAEPEEPTTVDERPDPEQPVPPKPTPQPPKPRDPFGKLAKAVRLPVVGARGSLPADTPPVSLGELHVGQGQSVDVDLIGGDNAFKGVRRFAARRGPDATAWLLRLESPTRSDDPPPGVDVARLQLDGRSLALAFLDGDAPDHANYLRNCVLRFRAADREHTISLATPQPADPLVLNLDTSKTRVTVPAAWLPESESVRLQVTGLEGPFARHSFDQNDTAPAREKVVALLAEKDMPTVRLETSFSVMSRTIKVETTVLFQIADQPPQLLTAENVTQMANQARARKQQLKFAHDRLPRNNAQGRKLISDQMKTIEAGIKTLENLGSFYQSFHEKGKVHFRVFAVVDDQEIDLFRTKGL